MTRWAALNIRRDRPRLTPLRCQRAPVAADNFKRAAAARPLNPSSIYSRNRVRSSDESADDMKHPPNRDEPQIKPNGSLTIQVLRSPL